MRLRMEARFHQERHEEALRTQQEAAQRQHQQRLQRLRELQQGLRQLLAHPDLLSEQEQQQLVQAVSRAGIRAMQVRCASWWGCVCVQPNALAGHALLPHPQSALLQC